MPKTKMIFILIVIIIFFPILLVIIEAIIAPIGAGNDYKNPERKPMTFENEKPSLIYVVLGDSTAAGVGADYDKGIAVSTAKYLAEQYNVTMYNLGISGGRVKDVLMDQVKYLKDQNLKPDLVLISIGGNDVTHITSLESITKDSQKIIDELKSINSNVKIVFTGSPNVGTSRRFAQPLRWLIELRSNAVNNIFINLVERNSITLAPIFKDTTEPFKNNPDLFYKDNFHPNEKGYAVWSKIIEKVFREVI